MHRILTDSATGASFDIALVERATIPELAGAGKIRALDELFASSELLHRDNLLDAAAGYATTGGRLYGIPVRINPYMLIADAEVLSAAGIPELPRDWTELIAVSRFLNEERVRRGQNKKWGLNVNSSALLFYLLCSQRGIDFSAPGTYNQTSAAVLDILTFIKEMRHEYSLLPPKYKRSDPRHVGVMSGSVLFGIASSERVAWLVREQRRSLFVGMVPSTTSPSCTYLGGSSVFVVSSRSDNHEAVLRFLEFFFSSEMYSRLVKSRFFVPPFQSMIEPMKGLAAEGDVYPKFVSAAEHADTLPLSCRMNMVVPEISRIVGKLDANLISVEEAAIRIQQVVYDREDERYPREDRSLRVQWAPSTRRLTHKNISDLLVPPLEIVSARNEYESIQLALSADRKTDNLEIVFGSFISDTGRSCEPEIKTYQESDTDIFRPMRGHEEGPYVNVLKPQNLFEVVPGRYTRIWVDVFAGGGIPADHYKSHMVLKQRGNEIVRVPVHLNVLPLCLPDVPSAPATIGLNYERIAAHYEVERTSREYNRLMDSFYWFLVKHRISPYQPPVPVDSPEIGEYLNDPRVSVCRLALDPRDTRFHAAVDIAKKGGWHEKLFAYHIDEPTFHQYEEILESAQDIRMLAAPPKFLVTCFPDDVLVGAVDIWGIYLRFLPAGIPHGVLEAGTFAEAVQRRVKAGDPVWWYTAGAISPFPTLHIEDDPTAFRVIPWLQQLYGISGFLHWEAANWGESLADPFVKSFGNGEGVLVYPDDAGPIPSLRLKLLREGLEDMEYLMLLRRGMEEIQKNLGAIHLGDVASGRVQEICRRLIRDSALRSHGKTGLFVLPHFIRKPGHLELVRTDLAREVLSIRQRPHVLVLTEPQEKQYTDSSHVRIFGIAEPESVIDVDGYRLPVDDAGNFSRQFPLFTGSNLFSITVENGLFRKVIRREIVRY
jgi:ABC-type glycerol-3-phosphate transport system substrate-binding protein